MVEPSRVGQRGVDKRIYVCIYVVLSDMTRHTGEQLGAWQDMLFSPTCTLRERPLSGRLNNCVNFT